VEALSETYLVEKAVVSIEDGGLCPPKKCLKL